MSYLNKIILIKLGGSELDKPGLLDELGEEILRNRKYTFIIVHGGGKEITKELEKHNIKSKFIDGLRLTSAREINIIDEVITNKINSRIVSFWIKKGVPAIGLSGWKHNLFEVKPKEIKGHQAHFVGEIVSVNTRILLKYLERSWIPVISPISKNSIGFKYNVNADEAAVAIAASLSANKLIFISDVPGVVIKDKLIEKISVTEIDNLIKSGIVKDGMAVKLSSILKSIKSGVEEAIITNWSCPDVISKILRKEKVPLTLISGGVNEYSKST